MHVLKWTDKENAYILKSSYELGFMSFYQRPFFKQHLHFGARTAVSHLKPGDNACIKLEQDEHALIYAAVKPTKTACVLIADSEYPPKVAIKILHDIMREFEAMMGLVALEQIDSIF